MRVVTFEAAPGTSHNLTINSGNLTCSASVLVSELSMTAGKPDIFGLVAISPRYLGVIHADVCALLRCRTADSCLEFVERVSALPLRDVSILLSISCCFHSRTLYSNLGWLAIRFPVRRGAMLSCTLSCPITGRRLPMQVTTCTMYALESSAEGCWKILTT